MTAAGLILALQRFRDVLDAEAPAVASSLAPPQHPAHVAAAITQMIGGACEDLAVWWGWHDGMRQEGAPARQLILGWELLSLAEAKSIRDREDRLAAAHCPRLGLEPDWVPILKQPEYATLYAATAPCLRGDRAYVVKVWDADSEMPTIADSLDAMVSSWLALIDAGVHWSEGRWQGVRGLDSATLRTAGY